MTDQPGGPYQASADAIPPEQEKKKSRVKLTLILIVVFLLAVIALQTLNPFGDPAVANLFSYVLGCAIAVILILKLFQYNPRLTLIPLGGLLVLIAFVRIDGVTGEMVPIFAWRWSQRHDETLTSAKQLKESLAAEKSTAPAVAPVQQLLKDERAFPRFLGPNGDARVDYVKLAPDWKANAPQEVWRIPIGAGWSGFVVFDGLAVTMEQRGSEELVSCYRVRDGELVWLDAVEARHETKLGGIGPRSTPLIHEGNVFALGATGILRCLDRRTGESRWEKSILDIVKSNEEEEAKAVAWGRAASPAIVAGKLLIPGGGRTDGNKQTLLAFSPDTGDVLWSAGEQQISYSSPRGATLHGVEQILYLSEGHALGISLDGEILWNHKWPGSSKADANSSQIAVPDDGHVFLSKGYGRGASLLSVARDSNGNWNIESEWESSAVLRTKFTNVVFHQGYAYGLSEGILECVDIATGEKQWKKDRLKQGQILGVGDHILAQAENGDLLLYEANPKKCVRLGKIKALSDVTWNNLCLYGDLLLTRNGKEAVCYRLPTID